MLAKGMVAAIDELRNVLPALFEGEDYQVRRRAIDEQFRSGHEEALEALNKKAQGQNIAILRTPTGFTMAPMHEGKVVKPEVFNALPEGMRREIESKVEALQTRARHHPRAPAEDRQAASRAPEGSQRGGGQGRHHRCDGRPDCRLHGRAGGRRLSGVPPAATSIRNVGVFLTTGEEENAIVKQPVDTAHDVRFRRYMVNVMVSHGDGTSSTGAPVVEEQNPTYGNLVGRVEHIAQMGTLVTDFLLIKPGALHRANGGYLLLDARRLLLSPFAWEALEARHQGRARFASSSRPRPSASCPRRASTPRPFRWTSR